MQRNQLIKDLLYNKLDDIYCHNCRHEDDSCCEECHRKHINWQICEEYAEYLAELILDNLKE